MPIKHHPKNRYTVSAAEKRESKIFDSTASAYRYSVLKFVMQWSVLLLSFSVAASDMFEHKADSALRVLDAEIAERNHYIAAKERRLQTLRNEFARTGKSNFATCRKLYEEYKNYQFDSLYSYARRMLEIATLNNNPTEIALSNCALLESYTSVGFFKEAAEIDAETEVDVLPTDDKIQYFLTKARMYQNLESYVGRETEIGVEYARLRQNAYDSVMQSAIPSGYEYAYAALEKKLIWKYLPQEAIAGREKFVTIYNIDDHQKAINHSLLGAVYRSIGDENAAIYHTAMSAIYDIRSMTRETTAAKDLSALMLKRNDLDRANSYIHLALDDAEFYNSRLRKIEINTILPTIENSRYDWIKHRTAVLIATVAVFVLLLLLSLYLLLKVRKRNRSLAASYDVIHGKTAELNRKNEELQSLNSRLKEANDVKDRFIIESIKANSYVNEVSEMSKQAVQKLKAKQYDDLKFLLYDMGMKKEWQRLNSSFDSAFLKLFPNFVDEYNKLFPQEYRVAIDKNGELPPELRIFALMRLGIDNPAEVAKYLNLSTNTIYVYKAKARAKSNVPKNQFDNLVMSIPKP